MPKLKINSPKVPLLPKDESITQELVVDQPVQEKVDILDTEDTFEVEYDQEAGKVNFQLIDGTPIQLKSPKAKQFLLVQSWYQNAPEDYQSDVFSTMKLAHSCLSKFGSDRTIPNFEEFLDSLEPEDLERVGAALNCFRAVFDRLAKKNSKV